MPSDHRSPSILAALTLGLGLAFLPSLALPAAAAEEAPRAAVKAQLAGASETVPLVRNGDGTFSFLLTRSDGRVERLSPEQFAAEVYAQQAHRGFWLRLLNITSPIGILWVGLGLLGQVLFAGRMLVQWLASEREKRSVVPPVFWWMSVVGSTMLIVYFIWRKDAVGVLGQATGWVIYLRNLWLIHRHVPT